MQIATPVGSILIAGRTLAALYLFLMYIGQVRGQNATSLSLTGILLVVFGIIAMATPAVAGAAVVMVILTKYSTGQPPTLAMRSKIDPLTVSQRHFDQ